MDKNASVSPDFVADVTVPDVFGCRGLTDRFDVVECIGYMTGEDAFQLWDNMASALRKDGKGYIVMEMTAGMLVQTQRRQKELNRVKFASYSSYDPQREEDREASNDKAALDEAYVELVTSVTDPARRYGNGQLQLVSVPLQTAPDYVQTYVCGRPENLYVVVRVVLRPFRERIVARNMRVRREHGAFVEGVVECARTARVDELEARLRSPHHALRIDDVFRVVEASLSSRRVDVFRKIVFDVYGNTVPTFSADLIDSTSAEMGGAMSRLQNEFTRPTDYVLELAKIQAELWSTCVAGEDDEAEMRTCHYGYAKRRIKDKTVLQMVANNLAQRRRRSSFSS